MARGTFKMTNEDFKFDGMFEKCLKYNIKIFEKKISTTSVLKMTFSDSDQLLGYLPRFAINAMPLY